MDTEVSSLIELGVKYGLPTVLLFVMLWLMRSGAKWIGAEILIPLRNRIIKFFDDHTDWMLRINQTTNEIRDDYISHHASENERLDDQDRKLDLILQSLHARRGHNA